MRALPQEALETMGAIDEFRRSLIKITRRLGAGVPVKLDDQLALTGILRGRSEAEGFDGQSVLRRCADRVGPVIRLRRRLCPLMEVRLNAPKSATRR